jgi:hypothetical protein
MVKSLTSNKIFLWFVSILRTCICLRLMLATINVKSKNAKTFQAMVEIGHAFVWKSWYAYYVHACIGISTCVRRSCNVFGQNVACVKTCARSCLLSISTRNCAWSNGQTEKSVKNGAKNCQFLVFYVKSLVPKCEFERTSKFTTVG